jgi:hypothetical protein
MYNDMNESNDEASEKIIIRKEKTQGEIRDEYID